MAGMPMRTTLRRGLAATTVAALASLLAGCQGRSDGAVQSGAVALSSSGAASYLAPPEAILATQLHDGSIRISGHAPARSRVELVSPEGEHERVEADRRGGWSVRLPGGRPHLYALSADVGGRTVHADGGLVTSPGGLALAVILRAGDAARPLLRPGMIGLASVDYDSSGEVAVGGGAAPHAALTLLADGAQAATGQADASGRYALIAANRRLSMGLHRLEVRGAGPNAQDDVREVELLTAPVLTSPYLAQPAQGGWRVTWALNGGGEQTTLILPPG